MDRTAACLVRRLALAGARVCVLETKVMLLSINARRRLGRVGARACEREHEARLVGVGRRAQQRGDRAGEGPAVELGDGVARPHARPIGGRALVDRGDEVGRVDLDAKRRARLARNKP